MEIDGLTVDFCAENVLNICPTHSGALNQVITLRFRANFSQYTYNFEQKFLISLCSYSLIAYRWRMCLKTDLFAKATKT